MSGYDAPKRALFGGARSIWRAAARRAGNVSRRRMDRRAAEDEDVAAEGGEGESMDAVYLEVDAKVTYPEDSEINGVQDVNGDLMPFLFCGWWRVRIRLSDGVIINWPSGIAASVHYKVCDTGQYWLQNADGVRVAIWCSPYVPDAFLCHGEQRGFGDYIIFDVDADGRIAKYNPPTVDPTDWIIRQVVWRRVQIKGAL